MLYFYSHVKEHGGKTLEFFVSSFLCANFSNGNEIY